MAFPTPPCRAEAPFIDPAVIPDGTTATLYFFLDWLGVILSSACHIVIWYLELMHMPEDIVQSMWNLLSFVLVIVSQLLNLSIEQSFWDRTKKGIEILIKFVGSSFYGHAYRHRFKAMIIWVTVWILCLATAWSLPYQTVLELQVVSLITNLISAVILILGSIFDSNWEHERYEAHSAILEGISNLCEISNSSGAVSISLILATVFSHWMYAALIYHHTNHQMQDAASPQDNELPDNVDVANIP